MIDSRFCTAGRNRAGAWFIACRTQSKSSLEILLDHGFTEALSTPPERHFDIAARRICEQGGLFWATNALDEYLTVAGIPDVVRSEGG